MTRRARRRVTAVWVASSLLVGGMSVATLGGCRRGSSEATSPSGDEGVSAYREAESAYRELVIEGVSPRDPRFDSVKSRLREVPAESKAHADAQTLLRRLEAPSSLPERPLAVPRLADEETPCEPLAQALGKATDAAERERVLAALRDCRAKEEKRKAHDNHPPGDDHEGHGH